MASVRKSVTRSVTIPIYLPIYLSFLCTYLSTYLSFLCTYLSTYLSIYLSYPILSLHVPTNVLLVFQKLTRHRKPFGNMTSPSGFRCYVSGVLQWHSWADDSTNITLSIWGAGLVLHGECLRNNKNDYTP